MSEPIYDERLSDCFPTKVASTLFEGNNFMRNTIQSLLWTFWVNWTIPEGPTVNFDQCFYKIVSLKESGSNFVGKAKILDTPMGRIAKSLIGEGVRLGVSSRGMGSIRQTKEGINVVESDFMLATAADIVADPSAPDAFVDGSIMEGKDWVMDGGVIREKLVEKTYKQINTLVDERSLQENKLKLFQDFLSNL